MHRLAVGEDNDAEPAPARFSNAPPTTNTAIGLHAFILRVRDYPGNPRVADSSAVAATPSVLEILGCFH
jgi:hypothetical protein